ncbi:MAG: hypothetical protein IMZ64_06555 [Bacteroidetes bacterium]|nr:hypothetical protein [Bacteroidota bacterium]
MIDLVMDRRIVWDSRKLKEVDEAKATIRDYRSKGYLITKADGTPLDRFIPNLEEVVVKAQKVAKRVMKILCEKGDERLVWDKENGKEAKEAKAKFEDLIAKGHTAYSVDSSGKKNRKIEEFDVDAEEILMVPKTAKG